jgi:DNA-binding response OmpR family regulator
MLMALLSCPTPRTILLVENESLLLNLVHKILKDAGFTVLCASTVEDALKVYAGRCGDLDLLLTALSMPRRSGVELAVELEGLTKVRVMLMSSQPDAAKIAIDHGWYFIGKPFLPSALLGCVREALGIEGGVSRGLDKQLCA